MGSAVLKMEKKIKITESYVPDLVNIIDCLRVSVNVANDEFKVLDELNSIENDVQHIVHNYYARRIERNAEGKNE